MGRMRFHNLCNFGITLPDNIYKVTYSNWGDDNFVSSPQFHISLDLGYSLFVSGAVLLIKVYVELVAEFEKWKKVVSSFMRKLVCSQKQNEVNQQKRHRHMPPLNASCSYTSCCPTENRRHGAARNIWSIWMRRLPILPLSADFFFRALFLFAKFSWHYLRPTLLRVVMTEIMGTIFRYILSNIIVDFCLVTFYTDKWQ